MRYLHYIINSTTVDLRSALIKFVQDNKHRGTTAVYNTHQRDFLKFCNERSLDPQKPETIAVYYIFLLNTKKFASKTIHVAASAVASLSQFDITKPCKDPLTKAVLKTVKLKARQPKSKKPLLISHLEKMATLVKPNCENIRDFLMITIMTVGMMRESEIVNLRTTDVWLEINSPNKEVLFVFVEKSKTDQERKGHTIVIGQTPTNKVNVITWYAIYKQARSQNNSPWFFYNMRNKERLAKSTPLFIVRTWLSSINIADPKNYGSHSCRRGGATAAAAAGIQERLIKRHGNWKSDAVHIYIEDTIDNRLSVANKMLS